MYLVKYLRAEKGCALARGQVCTFPELLVQAVWIGFLVEQYVGAVCMQVVEVRGHRVICWVESAELVAPPCPVNKMVERLWQQQLFKC